MPLMWLPMAVLCITPHGDTHTHTTRIDLSTLITRRFFAVKHVAYSTGSTVFMAVEGLVNVPISQRVLHSYATFYLKAVGFTNTPQNMLCKANVKISSKIRPVHVKSNSGPKI